MLKALTRTSTAVTLAEDKLQGELQNLVIADIDADRTVFGDLLRLNSLAAPDKFIMAKNSAIREIIDKCSEYAHKVATSFDDGFVPIFALEDVGPTATFAEELFKISRTIAKNSVNEIIKMLEPSVGETSGEAENKMKLVPFSK